MNGNIKAMAKTILIVVCVILCTFLLIYMYAPEPEQKMTTFHYQVPPQIAVRDKFEKRIGKQSYTIELAWVARTPDGHIYIERVR